MNTGERRPSSDEVHAFSVDASDVDVAHQGVIAESYAHAIVDGEPGCSICGVPSTREERVFGMRRCDQHGASVIYRDRSNADVVRQALMTLAAAPFAA